MALATSHALDKDIETQSLWKLKEIFLIKAKLTGLVVAQDSYLGKFLTIWVQFVDLMLYILQSHQIVFEKCYVQFQSLSFW